MPEKGNRYAVCTYAGRFAIEDLNILKDGYITDWTSRNPRKVWTTTDYQHALDVCTTLNTSRPHPAIETSRTILSDTQKRIYTQTRNTSSAIPTPTHKFSLCRLCGNMVKEGHKCQ